jgi:hypothetical protein
MFKICAAPIVASVSLLATLSQASTGTYNSAATADDSTWINADITSAIKSGAKSYTIAAGTYHLKNPIVVPGGLNTFALKGAGSTKTILLTPYGSFNSAIVVGTDTEEHNNWGLTNMPNTPVSPAAQGATTIKLTKAYNVVTSGSYVIYDNNVVSPNSSQSTSLMNRAEIIHVKAYNASTHVITLDTGLGRDYLSSPSLADVTKTINKSITVSGIGFNGANGALGTGGLLNLQLADTVSISDLAVTNYWGTAVNINTCRNVTVSGVTITDATSTGPGNGYGVCITRDRFATVSNVMANNNQQGVIIHGGSTDVTVSNSTSLNGGFDTHGMDERRITFTNCTSNGSLNAGNEQWWAGDSSITATNCTFGNEIFSPACSGVTFNNCTLGPLFFVAAPTYTTQYGKGYADNINLNSSTITGTTQLINEATWAGAVNFTSCTFNSTQTAWGNVVVFKQMAATIKLSNCSLTSHSVRAGDSLIEVTNLNSALKVTVTGCKFTSTGPVTTAVAIAKASQASVSVSSSTFKTAAKTSSLTVKD